MARRQLHQPFFPDQSSSPPTPAPPAPRRRSSRRCRCRRRRRRRRAGAADVPRPRAAQHRRRWRGGDGRSGWRWWWWWWGEEVEEQCVEACPGDCAAAAHGGRARAVHRVLLHAPAWECGARGRRRRRVRRWRGRQVLAPGEGEPLRARRVRRERRRRRAAGRGDGLPLRGERRHRADGREEQRDDVVGRRGVRSTGGSPELRPLPPLLARQCGPMGARAPAAASAGSRRRRPATRNSTRRKDHPRCRPRTERSPPRSKPLWPRATAPRAPRPARS